MASGRTHARVTCFATPAAAAVILVTTENPGWSAWAAAGCLAGILLSPDLDQETISHYEWKLIRATLGLGFLWLAFWGPYAAVIPHRSFLSHFSLLSTVLRILYAWVGLNLVTQFLNIPPVPPLEILAKQPEFLCAAFGLAVSDILHWVFDMI